MRFLARFWGVSSANLFGGIPETANAGVAEDTGVRVWGNCKRRERKGRKGSQRGLWLAGGGVGGLGSLFGLEFGVEGYGF
jgi:hypothetical protein